MTASRTAVIGLAHGSRHPGVTGPVDQLMAAASELTGLAARAAYLDLTEPNLAGVAAELSGDGVDRAVVAPLLFTNAFHARVDVPATVAAAAADSGLELYTAAILGTGDDIVEVVRAAVAEARIPIDLPILLYAVGSSDPAANTAVQALAVRLGMVRGRPALAAFGTTDPRPDQVVPGLAGDGPVAVVPLFVSPGLLLDPLARLARERRWPMTPPLGHRLASVVAARVAAALG